MRIPDLVAHRGYALHYPENTLRAVAAAIERGARLVEVDVQLSREGTAWLYHDGTTRRVSGQRGELMRLSDAEIRGLRAAERGRFGERFADEPVASVADLAQLLARHPDVQCFVEAKGESIELFGPDAMLDALVRPLEAVRGRWILISFDLSVLEAARRRGQPERLGFVLEKWAEREHARVRALDLEWIFCDRRKLPREGPLSAGGPKLAIYEVVDPREALELAARGADAVETFEVGELADALERLARGEPA